MLLLACILNVLVLPKKEIKEKIKYQIFTKNTTYKQSKITLLPLKKTDVSRTGS